MFPSDETITIPMNMTFSQMERAILERALEIHNGDKKRVAKVLGIATKTVYNKIHQHGLTGKFCPNYEI